MADYTTRSTSVLTDQQLADGGSASAGRPSLQNFMEIGLVHFREITMSVTNK